MHFVYISMDMGEFCYPGNENFMLRMQYDQLSQQHLGSCFKWSITVSASCFHCSVNCELSLHYSGICNIGQQIR